MTEERKLVTVLFADIVGSTAATAAEDPEIVRNTYQQAFGEMRELLVQHGATVEKFIGDAVMCVFGIPQAHDDDAERAVRAAFSLRSRIEVLSSEMPFPLGLRIGVNSGRVVTGAAGADTLVTGAAVNAAARLQQAAAPGEIVVGEVTYALTQAAVRYAPARKLEAKGLGEIDAYPALEVLDPIPTQHRGVGVLRAPLIGRDAELRLLGEAWRRVSSDGVPALITVSGHAGVGKSRLIAELVEIVGQTNVLRGRCLSYGRGITYWPVLEMLRTAADIGRDDSRDGATAKLRAMVLRYSDPADRDAVAKGLSTLAGLGESDGVAGPTADDRELRWAARRFFERRAQGAPLTLIFDDIHWAEPALLDLIEHVAERARAPLLVICLTRPELREQRPAWGAGIANAAALRLEPLPPAESGRLIAALLSLDAMSDDVRAEIIRVAGGNPLYVEELLRMLLDSGQLVRRDDRFVSAAPLQTFTIPATLDGLLAARLDQLDQTSKQIIRAASVIGQVFYPEALLVLGFDQAAIEEALVAAARRDLIAELDERGPGGQLAQSFKHILMRDAAYESMPKSERWRAHDAVGRWLEGEWQGGDEISLIVAHHAERAFWIAHELHHPDAKALGPRAFQLLLAAGRRARASVLPFPLQRDRYARAERIGAIDGAAAPELVEARGYLALCDLNLDGPSARPRVLAALEAARLHQPSWVLVELLLAVGQWQQLGAQADRSLVPHQELTNEALSVAPQLGDPAAVLRVLSHQAWAMQTAGHVSEALQLLKGALPEVVDAGNVRETFRLLLNMASYATLVGDWPTSAEAHERLGQLEGLSLTQRKLEVPERDMEWRRATGDLEDAVLAGAQAMAGATELGFKEFQTLRQRVARCLIDIGRPAEALVQSEFALRVMERLGTAGFIGETRQMHARALLDLGRRDDARTHAERAYGEIGDDDPYSRSTTALTLGLVREADGDFVEAERLLRRAIDVTGEFRGLAADARRHLGAFLQRRGRSGEARTELEQARDFYTLPWAKGWRDRIEDMIAQCDRVTAD